MAGTERIAVISDVHGNLTAFEAVLADIDARGITTVINLGDVAGKGPRGSASIALSRSRCAVTVRGNWDEFLSRPDQHPDATAGEAMAWWHAELSADDRAWLAALPLSHDLTLSGRAVRLFHASAAGVHTRVPFAHTREEFDAMFAATPLTGDGPPPTVVGYGDIHDAYVEVFEGRTLVNVGSVGNPLDETTAAYVVLEGVPGGTTSDVFGLQVVRVPYDVEAEIAVAAAAGMPELEEYAAELRTALWRGLRGTRPGAPAPAPVPASHVESPAAASTDFRTLPEPILLADTVASQPSADAPDPTMGRDPETDFMLRHAGG